VEERSDGAWAVAGEGRDARIGAGVNATLEARLSAKGDGATLVSIEADVHFSGPLAGLGQPVIRKKAEAMIQEFAANLKQALAAE
jgi:carbon monoxide dehydrogenase subunit G